MIVPFDSPAWIWGTAEHATATHLGRGCVVAGGSCVLLADVEATDGTIELELAVGSERAFHGVVWRARDDENYESFFVRPHQVGNPDAIQYTPVFHGISCWQLYHGEGYWAPVAFPLDAWFRIRVVFAGRRAEIFVSDLERPVLVCELKAAVEPGRIGVLVGGREVHLSEFAYADAAVLGALHPSRGPEPQGLVRRWEVSDAFPEDETERALVGPRTWTSIESEPSGLVNLARVQAIRGANNTVLARTTIESSSARVQALELGFSDRALAYLNGRPLFRGEDTYRSRDYRFLGSIGWFDTLYLQLEAGENELVVAVSEDFGGWGVQARLVEP